MKKTEILFTRVTKPNIKYLDELSSATKMSRAACLDEMLNYMRTSMEIPFIVKKIAKRRNEIPEAV